MLSSFVGLLMLAIFGFAMVVWLYLAVPWVCLRFVIVVFPDHTHYFCYFSKNSLNSILSSEWHYVWLQFFLSKLFAEVISIPFCATIKHITPSVLGLSRALGHPSIALRVNSNSFGCGTERYETNFVCLI